MEVIDDRLLQEAARWYARLNASDCTAQEHAEFELWRTASPAHAAAYARAEGISAGLERLMASGRLQALAERALDAGASRPLAGKQPSRWTVPAALAAGLALAAVGVHLTVQLLQPSVATVAYQTQHERRTVTLEDGSVVQLDVATQLEIRMSSKQRQVALVAGRASFDVAHDADRPFSVFAAGSRTTALGTKFQVQHDARRVIVTLAEGSVAVAGEQAQSDWREVLTPGEQLSMDVTTSRIDKQSVDLQRVTSWTRGRHVFRNTPLAEAVAEVNRYAQRKVRLGDSSLSGLPVGGSFIAGDSELIVDALTAVLPIHAVAGSGDEIILFRRYE